MNKLKKIGLRGKTALRACAFAFCMFSAAYSVFAESAKTVYISPNNDGVQDQLVVPFSVNEKRYVSEWSFVITDESGKVVRTIGNKEVRPEKLTFITFFKQLFKPKQGVLIPDSLIWNGVSDAGETVPDGTYFYYATAADDNGNVNKTSLYTVIVDNSEPVIELTQPSEAMKTFGAGNKADVTIRQTGSAEDLWTAEILDNSGKVVRTFTWKDSKPSDFTWDGKNNDGAAVKEGVYSYRISAVDRAGNKSPAVQVSNIIYDAVPRSVNMTVAGSPFSPNGDGVKDTVSVELSMPNSSGLLNWSVAVRSKDKDVRTFSSKTLPPASLTFDGRSDAGAVLADGDYQLVFSALFNNGQESRISRNITVDNTPPVASVRAERSIFSPDGDGKLDTMRIFQEGSKEKDWRAVISDEKGRAVKTWTFGETPAATVIWDGTASDGGIADGFYTYELGATDLAGNTGRAKTSPFELNTGTTEVILAVNPEAFSPNGDKIQDTVIFTPRVRTAAGIASYELKIFDASGAAVKTFSDKRNLPGSISWNGLSDGGTLCKDGMYSASLLTVSKNGSEAVFATKPFELDTSYPEAAMSAPYTQFSPNGDGAADEQRFSIRTTLADGIESWLFTVKNTATGETVYAREQTPGEALPSTIKWDGKSSNGRIAEGNLTGTLQVVYAKGDKLNVSTAPFICSVTPPKLSVRTAPEYFSPDNDGTDDDLFISLKGTSVVPFKSWSFEINDPNNGKTFWKTSGKSAISERIIWDGRSNSGELVQSAVDYPYKFTVTDSLGMTSVAEGIVSVDVLVIRSGDVLKMQVPSIIFRSDNADFNGKDKDPQRGLDQSIIDNNYRVLKRIAQILEKFRDYNVTIEGHANNISGTEREETSTANGNIPLVPLSEARAKTVKEILVSYGINASRLSTVGRGGRMPVAARADKDNWWKNRRVEFILIK